MDDPLPVLVNVAAATAARWGEALPVVLQRAFADTHRNIVLELLEPDELGRAFGRHAGEPIVVVAGGDGTLGSAAASFARTSTAIGMLPLGANNAAARELGITDDLTAAARICVTGERRRVDLGCLGSGKVFLASAHVGSLDRLHVSDARQAAWLGQIRGGMRSMAGSRVRNFNLIVNGNRFDLRSSVLRIGSHRPTVRRSTAIGVGLSDAALTLSAKPATGPLELMVRAFRDLVGVQQPERDSIVPNIAQTIIVDGHGDIPVMVDGEPGVMELPLRFSVLPSALGVVTPRVPARARFTVVRTL